jgi:hypothetical protein
MKLSVTKCFYDKSNKNVYRRVGEVVEYPEARAKEIENRGFGKIIEDSLPTKSATKSVKEEPKKDSESKKKKK